MNEIARNADSSVTSEQQLVEICLQYANELHDSFERSGYPIYASQSQAWGIGDDGTARPTTITSYGLGGFPLSFKESSSSAKALADELAEALRNDEVFGPAIGAMVGSGDGGFSVYNEDTIVNPMILRLVDENGQLKRPSKTAIAETLRDTRDYLQAKERHSKVIIPLPGFLCSSFPFVLEEGIEIDRLDDEEIDACAKSHLLTPLHGDFPMLFAQDCVGVRIAVSREAFIVKQEIFGDFHGEWLSERTRELQTPHRFGSTSPLRTSDLIENVLLVLRLVSNSYVGTSGGIVLSKSHMGNSRSWHTRLTKPIGRSNYVLDDEGAIVVSQLWQLLRNSEKNVGGSIPPICFRRFNAAVDRSSLEDSIIDLLIAAEALFLNDDGGREARTELGFRLSLRMSQFLEPERSGRDTYTFIKRAYDLRSRVAHGGSLPETVKIPGRGKLFIGEFIEELSNVMRDSIRKAIHTAANDESFRSKDYWDRLLFND